MQQAIKIAAYFLGVLGLVIVTGFFSYASANRFSSSSFTIDASVGNSFGGTSGSASYGLVSSGGEAVIGEGASGSYRMGQGYIAQLEQSMQINVQPSGLAAYYPFDMTSGSRIYDNSANSIDATLPASVTSVSGRLDKALNFSGANSVSLGNPEELKITGNQTISLWIKPTDFSQRRSVYSKAYGGEGTIMQEVDGKLRYMYGTSGGNATPFQYVETNAVMPTGVWTHVAIVRDLTNMKLTWYINGEEDVQVNANYASATSSILSATIGGGYLNNYVGELDEMKIFARALRADEVKADHEAVVAGRRSGVSLNEITPGVSQSNTLEAIVQTDGPSYGVSVSQNGDLSDGSNTIPAIASGTIASPVAWSEGTTKGLGFTVTSGLNLPAKWGVSPNYYYAAIPTAGTTFYNRSGYTGGVKDKLTVGYRLDVSDDQGRGKYTNTVTYGATIIP